MTDNTRRQILKVAAAGGGLAAFGAGFSHTAERIADHVLGREPAQDALSGRSLQPEFHVDPQSGELHVNPEQQISYTACIGCTTLCGVRVRIDKASGRVLRVAGNPYSPLSAQAPLPMKTSVRDSYVSLSRAGERGLAGRSTACGRGNAVIEQMYSPYRVLTPMKRVGPRHSGQWQPISIEQLIREVCEGGDLFGEGHVDGLAALRDLKTPIDAERPELGARVNQVGLFFSVQDGRESLARRFIQQAYGSINIVNHGAYCGGAYRSGSGAVFGDLKKMPHAKPDYTHAEFILFIGTAPGNAGNPFKQQGTQIARARTDGGLNYVVVDPVLTHADNLAARDRGRWVPIKPGTDGALAMALMRWLFDHQRFDRHFLEQPNQNVAEASGEAAWCNATHLIVTEPKHPRQGRFLRASDLGLALPDGAERYGEQDAFVVAAADGTLLAHDAASEAAQLFVDASFEVNGQPLKLASSLQLLREAAFEQSIEQYSAICGIPVETLAGLAHELSNHGKHAAVSAQGGMMAGNGFYNAWSVLTLNTLLGNLNVKGGTFVNGGAFRYDGPGPRYDLESFDGALKPKGIPLARNVPYEKSSEFRSKQAAGQPYPAQAPWYPNAPGLGSEWLPAMFNGYPYPLKALILWSANPLYGVPGLAGQVHAAIADPKRLPLLIAIDPFINETSAYADYIVPDALLYESWGWAAPWGGVPTKATTARWPVVEPRADKMADGQPIGMESFLITLAKTLGLPGFGAAALRDTDGNPYPLDRAEDWYLRAGANVAFAGKQAAPDASDDDLQLSGVERLRPQLEATLKPDEWRKVACIYSRGGRYQPQSEAYSGEWNSNRFTRPLQVYNETIGCARDSMTGQRLRGVPCWSAPHFADGTPLRARYTEQDWPLQLISYKSPLLNSYAIGASRLRGLHPENPVAMHPDDAARLGIAHGDFIEIETPDGHARSRVAVRYGVQRGVLAIEHGYGHRELGARAHRIGEHSQPEDARLAAGINLNDLGLRDPTRAGYSVWMDPIAGTAVRQGIPARARKAAA
ncbi:molybdopterin dinucleotide binding domain-containing protein [Plasticicumulans acidivorans]|uniref:Tetrathionate reductase subunit A n=1 Tax=Plasticicumulans acidivorans TaxID=886464 RepID=A0A317MXR3_9GAMM|nr:molybdopterin dinucleotide binding domain-containing protein [Plasticicumulans acidivorans]PWV63202.1 tetrathionate reductase subunit A [Plasticicumulans acidivorans]